MQNVEISLAASPVSAEFWITGESLEKCKKAYHNIRLYVENTIYDRTIRLTATQFLHLLQNQLFFERLPVPESNHQLSGSFGYLNVGCILNERRDMKHRIVFCDCGEVLGCSMVTTDQLHGISTAFAAKVYESNLSFLCDCYEGCRLYVVQITRFDEFCEDCLIGQQFFTHLYDDKTLAMALSSMVDTATTYLHGKLNMVVSEPSVCTKVYKELLRRNVDDYRSDLLANVKVTDLLASELNTTERFQVKVGRCNVIIIKGDIILEKTDAMLCAVDRESDQASSLYSRLCCAAGADFERASKETTIDKKTGIGTTECVLFERLLLVQVQKRSDVSIEQRVTNALQNEDLYHRFLDVKRSQKRPLVISIPAIFSGSPQF